MSSIWSEHGRRPLASGCRGSKRFMCTAVASPAFRRLSTGRPKAKAVPASGTGLTCGGGPGPPASASSPRSARCVARTRHRARPGASASTTWSVVKRSPSASASALSSESTSCARRTRPSPLRSSRVPVAAGARTSGLGLTCGGGPSSRAGAFLSTLVVRRHRSSLGLVLASSASAVGCGPVPGSRPPRWSMLRPPARPETAAPPAGGAYLWLKALLPVAVSAMLSVAGLREGRRR